MPQYKEERIAQIVILVCAFSWAMFCTQYGSNNFPICRLPKLTTGFDKGQV
jgi:hypothetical protein